MVMFFFSISFRILDRPLVSLESSTSEKYLLCEDKVKRKEKVSNINAAGIETIKICAEKWETPRHRIKIFIWFGTRLKMSPVNPLKQQGNMPKPTQS